MEKKEIKIFLLGLVYASIFGFSFMFTKMALPWVQGPSHLIFLRMGIAFLFMNVLLWIGWIQISFKDKNLWPVLLLSFFQPILYFLFETLGLKELPSSHGGIIISTIPVFVLLLARVILKEKLNSKLIFFVLLSIGGVVLIHMGALSTHLHSKGIFFLFLAVISAAFYTVLSRKAAAEFSSVEITYMMMFLGTIFFGIVSITKAFIYGEWRHFFVPFTHPIAAGAIFYLAIFSSCVAFLLLNYVLSHMPASKASVFSNFTTVVSIFAGVVILGEQLSWVQYVGCGIIIIGVYGAQRTKIDAYKS